MSITTYHKPAPSMTLPDWQCTIWSLRKNAADKNANSFKLRHEGRQIRNEANLQTKWDGYHSVGRLEDRVMELANWKEELERSLRDVDRELAGLGEERANAEQQLERIGQDLSVLAHCMALRETRKWADYVFNGAYCEFENERVMLETLKQNFTSKAYAAWEMLNRLRVTQTKLKLDISNKQESIDIDTENLELNKDSDTISFKIDAMRKPAEMLSNEAWIERMRMDKEETDTVVHASVKLRETMEAARAKAENDLAAQHEATDYALRNRIYQVQRAKNELDWQRKKALNELELLMKEICALEEALHMKTSSEQLAQTRLEKRLYRPGNELACDEAHEVLIGEAERLATGNADLRRHTEHVKSVYNEMEKMVISLDDELESKNQAICIDMRCLDLRKSMYTGDRAPLPTQTDRNVHLVGMEEEIPPE